MLWPSIRIPPPPPLTPTPYLTKHTETDAEGEYSTTLHQNLYALAIHSHRTPPPPHPPQPHHHLTKHTETDAEGENSTLHHIKTFMLCSPPPPPPPISRNIQKQIQKMKTPQHYIRIFMLGHPVAVERAVVDEELTVGHFHCPNSKRLPINVARHVGL